MWSNFYESPHPRRLDKSLSSLSVMWSSMKRPLMEAIKKPIKLVTLVKLALPSPPYGNSDMKSSDKNNEGFIVLEFLEK